MHLRLDIVQLMQINMSSLQFRLKQQYINKKANSIIMKISKASDFQVLFLRKGGDNIYSIFGKDIVTGKYVSEDVEKIYTDWIFDTFEHYKQYPPTECKSLDDIARFITKEFNVKKYIFETGNNKSLDTLKVIMDVDLDEIQSKDVLQQIGEQTSDNEKWVSEIRIFELLKCLNKIEASGKVVVMHPEINGIKEEQEKIR